MTTKDRTCSVRYFPSANTVRIKANSTDFYPQYLKYVLEYLKIPQNATLVFKDKVIEGGIKQWLNQEQ